MFSDGHMVCLCSSTLLNHMNFSLQSVNTTLYSKHRVWFFSKQPRNFNISEWFLLRFNWLNCPLCTETQPVHFNGQFKMAFLRVSPFFFFFNGHYR